MKEVTTMAAQGDVLFRRIEKLPAKAQRVPPPLSEGRLVVAHSETGHHHAISGFSGEMWQEPGDSLVCFLQMGRDVVDFTDIVHYRPHDTHETLRLKTKPGDVWEVRRQKEHTPEGWRRVED